MTATTNSILETGTNHGTIWTAVRAEKLARRIEVVLAKAPEQKGHKKDAALLLLLATQNSIRNAAQADYARTVAHVIALAEADALRKQKRSDAETAFGVIALA